MKKTLPTLAALFALGGSFAVYAQTPASVSMAVTASVPATAHTARHEARVEERITYLHKQLKITQAQEARWKPFADTMRENGETMGRLYRERIANKAKVTALEDVKQYAEISRANAEGAKKLVDTFEPLYSALSPEQKALADKTFRERWDHPRHPGAQKPAAPDAGNAPATP